MNEPISIFLNASWSVVMAIMVLCLGRFLKTRIRFLDNFNIPEAVIGGVLCSGLVAVLYVTTERQIEFDLSLRDLLLLVFFSTIGLSAKFGTLIDGGKSLAILVVCAVGMLVLQNIAGIAVAKAFGVRPAYGLLAGSVAFAGGHGSVISYGRVAADHGRSQPGGRR